MKFSPRFKTALPVLVVTSLWLVVWGWSALVVQPSAEELYQEKSRRSLVEAGILDTDGKILDLTNWLSKQEPTQLAETRQRLNEASLYLRRLIDVAPNVSVLSLQLALTAEASAQLNTKLSDQALANGEVPLAEKYRRKSISDNNLAQDTMERLSREDNEQAMFAKSWELARSLRLPIRDFAMIEQLTSDGLEILKKDPTNRIGIVRLGQLRILRAFSIESPEEQEKRTETIQNAVELLSKIESPSMIEQSFLAEAQDALSPELAIQTSIVASQRYWGELSTEKQSVEGLAAFFSCLVRIGNLPEAQSLVATKLASLSPNDQIALRGLCSDYCLRLIECQHLFPSDQRQIKPRDALLLATRIYAQSPSLLMLLDRLVVHDAEDVLSQQILSELATGRDVSLYHLIAAIQGAVENQLSTSRDEIQLALAGDQTLSSATVAMVNLRVENRSMTIESAKQFLEIAMSAAPDATALFFASAVFFDKHGELDKAAECLEKILVATNNDAQILAFLAALYSRLDRSDDLKRIQSELQKLRKRPS